VWPDRTAWTIESLDQFWHAFVEQPDEGKESFVTKWAHQLSDQSADVHRVAVDLAALYGLFPSNNAMGPASKSRLVSDVRAAFGLNDPDQATTALLSESFQDGLGSPGQHYLTGRPYHMAFFLGFARQLKKDAIDPTDVEACTRLADRTVQVVKSEFGHSPRLSRNMLLNLLFPDMFEPIASDDHKDIRAIRKRLLQENPNFRGFYDGDVYPLWNQPSSVDTTTHHPEEQAQPYLSIENGRVLGALQHVTYLHEEFLREIDELLFAKRQLIFEGPPGSGKTYVAEKFARWFTGQPVDDDTPLDKHVEIVQFHQSYGYEDFVQGIRPETNSDNQLVYRVRDGIFLDMVERARANPEDRFVLIIDEINRGNLSRVFGELLLLLEYRGQRVRLPYGVGDAAYLSIPENLYIIGTMNTADRSLAQIDYALRRRFYFVRFMPVENGRAEVYENWLARNVDGEADRQRLAALFIALNHGIRNHLDTDDLEVGHSYFMQSGIETDVVFDRVWRRAVRPLLEEYLHHHRQRDEILADLIPQKLATLPAQDSEAESETDATGPESV
jgi:MoxR-like ATPase